MAAWLLKNPKIIETVNAKKQQMAELLLADLSSHN